MKSKVIISSHEMMICDIPDFVRPYMYILGQWYAMSFDKLFTKSECLCNTPMRFIDIFISHDIFICCETINGIIHNVVETEL